MTISRPDPATLVRHDTVHSRVYTDPAVFDLEMTHLFARAWLLLGHESQLPDPGSFLTGRLARQDILLVRDNAGGIRGYVNRCTHRGARLCNARSGKEKHLQCPYHGWTFDLDGTLKAVPAREEYPETFDLADHGLAVLPHIELYRGFIFGTLDPATSLIDYLGPIRSSIDDLVDRSPTGRLSVAGPPIRHRFRANWKLMMENLNDAVHAGVAHRAATNASRRLVEKTGGVPPNRTVGMMLANGKPLSFFQQSPMVTAPWGHSYIGGHIGQNYRQQSVDAYGEALSAHHGAEKAREILAVDRHLTLQYPNATWHGRYQTVRIIQPLAVDLTEVTGFVMKLEGAPAEILHQAIEYASGSTSAASPVITDDLYLYETIQRANMGDAAGWLPLARRLNETRETDGAEAGKPDMTATSEGFIRNQYAAWKRYMGSAAHA